MQIALPFLVAQQHTRLVHQSAGVERRQIKLCRSGRLRTLSLKYNNPGSICQRQLLEINVTFQTNVTFYANVTIQVKRPSVELLWRILGTELRGFFRSLRPFLQVGVGVFIFVVLGEVGQSLGRRTGVPLFMVLVAAIVAAVFVTALYLLFRGQ